MTQPYLLIDGEDLTFFRSVDALARHVESPDIDDYVAVDGRGCKVELSAINRKPRTKTFGVTSVTPVMASSSNQPMDQGELREHLMRFLSRWNEPVAGPASCDELMARAAQRAGFAD